MPITFLDSVEEPKKKSKITFLDEPKSSEITFLDENNTDDSKDDLNEAANAAASDNEKLMLNTNKNPIKLN